MIMKNNKKNKKELILKEKIGSKEIFGAEDIIRIFQVKQATAYWLLWDWKNKNLIHRISRGKYSFQKKEEKLYPVLSNIGKKVYDILISEGIDFFISGLDILQIFMLHIPEKFPVVLFVESNHFENSIEILQKNRIIPITEKKYNDKYTNISLDNDTVLLRRTKEMKYQEKNRAIFEKAFFDIYYEITRNNYPLSLQELGRIFLNMKRRMHFDLKKLLQIASRKHLEQEFRFILNYDKINKNGYKFIEYLERIEKENAE